jgi:hypothetical protein
MVALRGFTFYLFCFRARCFISAIGLSIFAMAAFSTCLYGAAVTADRLRATAKQLGSFTVRMRIKNASS